MHVVLSSLWAAGWLIDWQNWGLVALGLGMVIFVHELGHFVVAKACGVKCEKFYLGFDIFGLKLARFRWGETEYGIGVLPLGGYVKMLGQEDNPTKAAEEFERAKLCAMPLAATYCPRVKSARDAHLRSAQLPGQERAQADGHYLGRGGDECDLRLCRGGGRLSARR